MRRAVMGGVLAVLIGLWSGIAPVGQAQRAPSLATNYPIYLPIILNNWHIPWVWSPAIPIALNPAPNIVVMALDEAQSPHLLWDIDPLVSSDKPYIYHRYLVGTVWAGPYIVAPTTGEAEVVSPPALSPDGLIHLMWRVKYPDGSASLWYAPWKGYWDSPDELFNEFDDPYPTGVIRIDNSGDPSLVGTYQTASGTEVIHTIFHLGFLEGNPIGVRDGVRQAWPDAFDGARIYGDNVGSPGGWYEYWRGGSLLTSSGLSQVLGDRTGILDGANNLHLFHLAEAGVAGSTTFSLYHQCLDRNLRWGPVEMVSGTAVLSGYPSEAFRVAVSPQGNIAAAYVDSKSKALGVLTWQGCQLDSKGTLAAPTGVSGLEALAFSELPSKLCVLRDTNTSNFTLVCGKLGGF